MMSSSFFSESYYLLFFETQAYVAFSKDNMFFASVMCLGLLCIEDYFTLISGLQFFLKLFRQYEFGLLIHNRAGFQLKILWVPREHLYAFLRQVSLLFIRDECGTESGLLLVHICTELVNLWDLRFMAVRSSIRLPIL